jgi:hypothetical protein
VVNIVLQLKLNENTDWRGRPRAMTYS